MFAGLTKPRGVYWLTALITAILLVFTGVAPAQATHLRGAVGTVTYDAASKTVTVNSLMLERKDACLTYSATNTMCTNFAFPVITQVNRTTGAVVGTITACTGQNTRPTVQKYDNTSDPLFNIFQTTFVVDVSCPTFTTAYDYVFSQVGSNRIGGIKNSSNVQIQFEARVSFLASNSTPFYNSGYQSNVAYDEDPTHFFTTNLNALSSKGKSVKYDLVTNETSALGGYGSKRIPCSDLNLTTGVFRLSSSLCVGTENYRTAFSGGTVSAPIYYVLKTKATDDLGQYATRDVLLQFAPTTNARPSIARTSGVTTPTVTLTKGQTTTITYQATDADSTQTLAFSTNTLPSWASFTWAPNQTSPATATLVLTPLADTPDQALSIQVSVTDSGAFPLAASDNLDVTLGSSIVLPPGSPGTPTVTGVRTSTTLSATFAQPTTGGTPTSYSLTATPTTTGASVTVTCAVPSSGLTQTCSIPGVLSTLYYTVVVTAINASGSASSSPSQLTVPILAINASSVTLNVGTAYTTSSSLYSITNSGGAATYTLSSGTLPTGLSIDSATGQLVGTPSAVTTGSGNALVILGTNAATGETATVSVLVTVVQSLATPVITFPAIGQIYKTATVTAPTYSNGVVTGNVAPLRATSTNSGMPIKYSTSSNPTSSGYESTGTANGSYSRPTSGCQLWNLNGVVYVSYYSTSTSSTKTCTIYANQDATTGWNKATQVSVTLSVNKQNNWSGATTATPAPSITPSAIVGTVNSPITSFGITYSSSSPGMATQGCTLASSSANALPSWATLNTQLCSISGAPNAIQTSKTYTLQFVNPAGTSTGTFTITVNGRPQTITFTQGDVASTAPLTLNGTATSGLTVTYAASPSSVCTVSGATATWVSNGTCTITASQSASGSTIWAPATNIVQAFRFGANTPVLVLDVGTSADKVVYVQDNMLKAISFADTANTAVSYKIYDAAGQEVTSLPDGLSFNGATGVLYGSPEVKQAKTAYYIVAANANGVLSNKLAFTLTILPLSQTIDFAQPQAMVVGQPDQGLGAIASSSLLVTYTVAQVSAAVCRINADGTVTALSAGTCSITASQPGDGKAYLAATPITRSFAVSATLAPPSITLTNTEIIITVGQPFPLPFDTINSDGKASYTISPALPAGLIFDPNYGVISNSIATIASPRTQYTITASNTSNGTLQIDSKSFWLTVVGTPQSISLSAPSVNMTVSTTSTPTKQQLAFTPDSQSLLPATSIVVTSGAGTVCSLDQATLLITAIGFGTCVITATQAGDSTYSSATATLTIAVHQAPGLSLLPSSLSYTVGSTVTNPFTISTSGDPVRFELRNAAGAVVTIPGLSYSATTGQLTGTATTAQALTTYTVAAINSYGTTTKTFQLEVLAAVDPMVLTFTSTGTNSMTLSGLTIGVAATPAYTITNTGTLATSFSISGTGCNSTIAGGLTFSASTGLLSGTPTSKIGSQLTCIITGSNPGSGTAITGSLTLTIPTTAVAIGLPVVTTNAASAGTGTAGVSWKFNGSANFSGATTGGSARFCYGLTTAIVTACTNSISASVSTYTQTNYVSTSTTLTAGNTYYFRFEATNAAGTAYGAMQTVNAYTNPLVVTTPPTQISATSYLLNGTVDNKMSATTDIHFCYNTTGTMSGSALASCTSIAVPNLAVSNTGTSSAVAVSTMLIANSANPTYYYQLVATNATGTVVYGSKVSITVASVPSVVTGDASRIGTDSASIDGVVNPGNASTVYAVCYKTTVPAADSIDCDFPGSLPTALTGVTDHLVSIDLTGLLPRTLYYYRVMARNSAGTTYGEVFSFMTTGPPLVEVGTAQEMSATSFQLVGTVNPSGLDTTRLEFCYVESTSDYAHCTVVPLINLLAGVTAVTVTKTITGLTAGTTYHFWLSADNGSGLVTSSSYGSFTTGAATLGPTLTPLANSSITNTSASANVTLSTGNLTTSVYVCYGLTADLSACTYELVSINAASTSTSNLTNGFSGLSAGTKYYYSFKAVNALGTVYSTGWVTTTGSSTPLSVTTTTLASGVVGQSYSEANTFIGGVGPFVWSISGTRPPGLSIDYLTGTISGAPTFEGTYDFDVVITDSTGKSATKPLEIVVTARPVPLSITTLQTDLPAATVNTAFTFTFGRAGGQSPFTWARTSGALPTGLSLSSAGVLSGTPTATGLFTFTLRVTDSTSGTAQTSSSTYSISVGAQPLSVTTTSLAVMTSGLAYSETLVAAGGTNPYTWALGQGVTLPTGLTLSSAGVLTASSGNSAAAGSYALSFVVTDSRTPSSTSESVVITLQVIAAPTISATTEAGITSTQATVGADFIAGNTATNLYVCASTSAITTTSCDNANSWVLVGSDSGITTTTLSKFFTGLTLGTTYNYIFKARNSVNSAYSAAASFATTSQLGVATATLDQRVEGVSHNEQMVAVGGTGAKTWSLAPTSAALPGGLALNPTTGVLYGTPDPGTAGQYTIVLRATDTTSAFDDSIDLVLVIVASATVANPGVEKIRTTNADIFVYVNPGNLPTTVSYCYDRDETVVASCTNWIDIPGTVSGVGSFKVIQHLTGLTPNTQYYFRFRVINDATGSGGVTTASLQPAKLRISSLSNTGSVGSGGVNFQIASAPATFVTPPALAITNTSLSNAVVGTPGYSQTLVGTGGEAPYAWTLKSGFLPPGLRLDGVQGLIYGTPSSVGTYTFTIALDDAIGSTQTTATYTVVVGGAPILQINSESNLTYSTVTLNASVNTKNFATTLYYCVETSLNAANSCSWTQITAVQAAALTAADIAIPVGQLQAATPYYYRIRAVNWAGETISSATTFTTASAPVGLTISPTSGATLKEGQSLNKQFSYVGGTSAITWSITGTLPAGLTFDSTAGTITGSPDAGTAGNYSVDITVADSSTSSSLTYTITVYADPSSSTYAPTVGYTGANWSTTVNTGNLQTAVSYCISTTNSSSGCTWSSASNVAAGSTGPVNKSVSNLSSGTTYYLFIKTANSSATTISSPAIAIQTKTYPTITTSGSIATRTVGVSGVGTQIVAIDGSGTYTNWAIATGSLPAGLRINSNGQIVGTPDVGTEGDYTFTVSMKDTDDNVAESVTITLSVNNVPLASYLHIAGPTSEAATISIHVDPSNEATTVKYCLRSTNNFVGCTYTDIIVLPAGITDVQVDQEFAGLTGGQTYYYSFIATNSVGDSTPVTGTFTTSLGVAWVTTSLPNSTVGTEYYKMLQADGGSGTFHNWVIKSGALPDGVTLDGYTGELTGTPTTAGNYTVVFTSTDTASPAQSVDSATFTIVIDDAAPITITAPNRTQALLNTNSNFTFTSTGGIAPITWAHTAGNLPTGMSFNSSGVVSGSPSALGTYTFTVTASGQAGTAPVSIEFTITIIAAATASTGSATAVNDHSAVLHGVVNPGNADTSYYFCYSTSEDLSNCTATSPLQLVAADLFDPTVDVNVEVTVSTLTPGTQYYFKLFAENASGQLTDLTPMLFSTIAALSITSNDSLTKSVGSSTGFAFEGMGGDSQYTWTRVSGDVIPAGLTLGSDGSLSGSTDVVGTYVFVVQLADASNTPVATQTFTLTIIGHPAAIVTATDPSTTSVSVTISANAHSSNTTLYICVRSSLADTCSYTAISGTVTGNSSTDVIDELTGLTAGQTYYVSVFARNALGDESPVSTLSFTTATSVAPLAITSSAQRTATRGSATTLNFTATGGAAPRVWSISAGTLPAGMSLSSNGVLSGTPTAAGTYTFTVKVTDAAPTEVTQVITLVISEPSGGGTTPPPVVPPVPPTLPVITPVQPGGIIDPLVVNVTQSGKTHSIPLVLNSSLTGLSAGELGWTLQWGMKTASGIATKLNAKGQLVIQAGQFAHTAGAGFMPNTDVHIYIFSTPQLLGILKTDAKGEFVGDLMTPLGLALGIHTLQVSGYTTDGVIRTADIAVSVEKPAQTVLNAALQFMPNSYLLTKTAMTTLKRLALKVGKKSTKIAVVSIGYVYPTSNTALAKRLSLLRAKAVNAYLKKLGIRGTWMAIGGGRLSYATAWSRRVNVTVNYTPAP
jgi:phosphodiesterase/alkaline phosphatase D-like protein